MGFDIDDRDLHNMEISYYVGIEGQGQNQFASTTTHHETDTITMSIIYCIGIPRYGLSIDISHTWSMTHTHTHTICRFSY